MRLLKLLFLCLLSTTLAAQDGEISGRSWLDNNRDGFIDPGEPGQPAEVLLTRRTDGFTISTTTDSEGNYAFTGLELTNYVVEFIPEGRVIPTFGNFGVPANGDSQLNSYTPPFQTSGFLRAGLTSSVINAGWVDDGEICNNGRLSIRREPKCSLNDPEPRFSITAVVNPPNEDYTFAWSDGQTTPTALFVNEGNYSVTVTDPEGCNYVTRGIFRERNFPVPTVQLPDVFIPCGEDVLRYALPDSILNAGFDISPTSPQGMPLGIDVADLLDGEVDIDRPGEMVLLLTHPETDCQLRVIQDVGQPVPTDELSLEVTSFSTNVCLPNYTITVRGGIFDTPFDGVTSPGHTTTFYGPGGQEPTGFISSFYRIARQPPGTYTAVLTSACGPDRVITVTTPEAETCRSVSGRLVLDQSGGCTADGGFPVPETMIAFTSTTSDREFFAFTGSDGVWSMDLPEDTYTIRPLTNSQLQATYCDVGEVTVSSESQPGLDLILAQRAACPVLTTEVLMPRLRRDFQTISYVTYRNEGTGPAEDVQLEVTVDPFMETIFSDTPFTREGDTYTFSIGDLPALSGGRIPLRYFLIGAEPGQHHCISSKITPADLCSPPVGWQGGIISTDYAACDGDVLTFTVANVGTAATTVDVSYYVLRNGELEVPETSLGSLPAGASREIELPANGDTYQIFTNQEPNAPAAMAPSALAEGCGRNAGGDFVTGFTDLFPVGNGLPGEALTCRTNTGSFDPNEKIGYPLGVGTEKDIEPGTRITYDIHFQNTGTDTAIFVIIKDTLPEALDLSTLELGGASHDYVASLDTNRVLTFRFENILLPDSTTNLAASQGLVQFSIDHDTSLERGDRFQNNAAIFFDFNEPVITDFSRHRIAPQQLIDPEGFVAELEATDANCGLADGSLTVSISAGTGPFTFVWSHDPNLSDPVADDLPAGVYTVTVTPTNGNSVTLSRELFTSDPISELTAPMATATTCGGDNGSIQLNLTGGTGNLTYSWDHANQLNEPTATDLAPGNYAVTATDENGCDYTAAVRVDAIPQPELRTERVETAACAEDRGSASFILLNFAGETDLGLGIIAGTTTEWESLGPDSARLVVNNLPAGAYAPKGIDGNGCTVAASFVLTVADPSFTADFSVATNVEITESFPALEQSLPTPDSVTWLFDEAATLSSQEGRTYFFEFDEPGDYTLGLVAYLRACVDSTFVNFTILPDSSTTASVNVAPASSINLRVAPNPSQGDFTITADLPVKTEATAQLYGPTGRLILERKLPRAAAINERFDVNPPAGVYFLQILTAETRWLLPVMIR